MVFVKLTFATLLPLRLGLKLVGMSRSSKVPSVPSWIWKEVTAAEASTSLLLRMIRALNWTSPAATDDCARGLRTVTLTPEAKDAVMVTKSKVKNVFAIFMF